jgi:trehalose 6-phosphate phosphatase
MYWENAQATLLKELITRPRLGLITDMDGTLSPIVDEPDAAQVTPRNYALLQALHKHLTLVAVVSGRAVDDVRARVGLSNLVYVGNHGMERWTGDHIETSPAVRAFRPALEKAIQDLQPHLTAGMRLEDKGVTISIHYRQTADPDASAIRLQPIIQRISTTNGLNCFRGRRVFELRPPVDIDKGSVFSDLIHAYKLDAALYLGDDTTDADALQMARQLRYDGICYSLGVGVESDDMPAVVRDNADLLAVGVDGIESLLAWLLAARSASST